MTYLRRAFQNGVKIYSEIVTKPIEDVINQQGNFYKTPLEIIGNWNRSQISTAPIQWHYFLISK